MTHIYFVRHALSDKSVKDDRLRPLTQEGLEDAVKAAEFLKNRNIDLIWSSPYQRSMETVKPLADFLGKEIHTDEDFRERAIGSGYGNDFHEYIRNLWSDYSFKSIGAESLSELQARNIRALNRILQSCSDRNIVIGTHGAALSTILKYYDPNFEYGDFIRILNYLPYIVRLDFQGTAYLGRTEEYYIEKQFI